MPPKPARSSTRTNTLTSPSSAGPPDLPTPNMILDHEHFQSRHIGPDADERDAMLNVIGAPSLDALMDQAIPARIRRAAPLNLPDGLSERQFLRELRQTASRNEIFRSFLGLGYYDCTTPSVIVRNVLENPGWYTPYTPYQAEVAQG